MTKLTLDQMILITTMLGYTKEELMYDCGLSRETVRKIMTAPQEPFTEEEKNAMEYLIFHPVWQGMKKPKQVNAVHENSSYGTSPRKERTEEPTTTITWKKQGTYTLEDYLKIPDEHRVELIDGVLYDMSSPYATHQIIGMQIYTQISIFIASHGGACIPFAAPMDVQLDRDDRTIVQPDVFVVCDRDKVTRRRIFGAPDLVIEVLSPSTRKKDMNLKRIKYQRAGVKEYWMIDPKRLKVIVELFGEHPDISLYSFEDQVPVSVFQGECKINFAQIYEQVRFLYEQPD